MYNFKPYSDRIARLNARVRDRLLIADPIKTGLKAEGDIKYRAYPPMLAKVMTSKYIFENMPMDIDEDEFFAGGTGAKNWGGCTGFMWTMMPIEQTWPLGEDGLYHAPEDDPIYSKQKLAISPEDLKIMRERDAQTMAMGFPESWMPDGYYEELHCLEACTYGRPGGFPAMLMPGHLTPGFQNLLAKGMGAIRKVGQDFLDEHRGNCQGDEMGRYMFYKAATIACDNFTLYANRYAEIAAAKAEKASGDKKAEYLRMADSLKWISTEVPRNFFEACQLVMLYNAYLKTDNDPGVTSMGRFDQYIWPFLKADLEAGTITMEEAQELVDSFFIKLNLFYNAGFGKMVQTAGIGHIGQHTTVGGCDKEGKESSNPVTYMVLEAVARLQLHEPTVSLRVTKDTPAELWECALSTSMKVGGLPLFQNDDVIIPGLLNELHYELEDARDYSFIGCQEIVGSGNDYPAPNGQAMGHNGIYWQIALDMTMNNGINPMNGRQAPEKVRFGKLYEMNSFEEFQEAYYKTCEWMLTWSATLNNYAEHEQSRLFPFPNLSIVTTGCMESGKDVSEGGAKYNSFGGTATGLATAGDSLTAIKYLCFDKKICTTRELYDAVMANWVGHEDLQQIVKNKVPRYGNNDPYADQMQKWVFDTYYKITRAFHNPRSSYYRCGMFGAADHVPQGEISWATPDGRNTGEPIADAASPVQGMDKNGPTSVFNSCSCFDQTRFLDGMALNMRIHPTAMQGAEGMKKLADMTRGYFNKGGMEVQYNIVDSKTLRAAQAHPEDYHNLVVRIAGYSAYFVDMTTEMQNDIISRNEHSF